MAIEYKGGTRATCVNSDIISDSLGKSGDGAVNGASVESVHSQSSAGSISGLDLYQTTGGGGWGMRFNSGHAIVGSKLKKFKVWTRINNPSNRSDQDMTCKVYDGTDKTTVRASSNSINTSVLDQGSTFEDVEFTFSSPVVINAGDVVVVSCPSDLGTAGSWNCEIKESADTNGHFVTWIDNGSFTLQTSRCLKYDATLPVESKVGSSAYTFDGSNDFVEVSGQTRFTEINNPNQISTIVFWYKSSSSPSSTYDKIMGTVDQSASDRGFNIMRYQGSGKGMISLTQAGGNKGLNDFATSTGLFPVDGNWYHYAFKFDDVAGKLSIYKDGSLFEEEDYASWTPATGGNTQRPFQIGKDTSNSKWFNGQIDDCAIYYRGLTATEIEKLVNNNSPSPNITNSPAYTQVGSTVVASGTTIEATNCQSNQNPVHRVYKDIGSVSDSTFYFEFDYKQKQNTNNLFPIALQSGTGKTNIASEDMIYLKTDGLNMTIAKKNGGSNTNSSDGWITIVANTQYYCSITRSSNTASLKVYTDSGRSSNQVGGTKTVSVSDVSGLQYIHSESRGDGGGGTNIGWVLDNISLTNGATTKATEGDPQLVSSLSNKAGLKAHYSMDAISGAPSGIAPDDGGNANSYSNVSVDTTNKKAGTGSYDFADGGVVGNANQSYGISGTASWTISCWIRPHAVGSNEALFRKQHTNGTSDFEFGVNSSNIFCWIEGNSTNMVSSPANNTWYHLVVRRVSGDKDYFYVNGSEVSSTSTQNSIDDNSGFRWYLGRRKESGNETFNGNMDEWGIWNRALTTSEITALYNSGDGAKIDSIDTTDLVIYWNFEQVPLAQQALPKCSNDASATSDLDVMTNLPENTLFLQTDDTPSYWWKQSDNTWKLDGGSEINVPMTSDSWTFQGNQGSAHTHSIDNGVKWVSQYANNKLGAGVAVGTIGATLGSKWVARYNWTGTGSYTEGGNGYVIIGLSDDGTYGSSDTTNTQGGDSAQVQWHIGNNSGDRHYRVRGWNGGSNTDGSTTGGNTVPWVAETQYFELSYDGTTLKHQRYTDSTYSTAHSVVTPTKDISGITGLTHIIFGSNDTGHSHGGFTLTLNEFKIQKGFSEWQ